jgi:hypothetical protein
MRGVIDAAGNHGRVALILGVERVKDSTFQRIERGEIRWRRSRISLRSIRAAVFGYTLASQPSIEESIP